jgi:serine/threonine protein kinase
MAQSAHDYQPGQRVPGTVYQVVRLIGAGGMGTVYDVEDTTIGKRYVLKTLHPRLGTRDDLARRMRSEARTLARLHHPNIVDVITAGVTTDSLHLPFYVMERLSGQSLRVVLDKKFRLELAHALHIEIDLLDALDHAHDKGVIHRDVKPDNIYLHRTIAGVTVTKLLDFGIMSLLDAAPNEQPGRFMGTLRYAAPEQLRGEKPSPRVDVYAAGLVIYEMLTGRGPFDDEGEPERIATAHLQKEPPAMSRFADVPKELDELVAVALSKSPWCRPRDAFSFATSLRNIKRVLLGGKASDSTESRTTAVGAVDDASPAPAFVRVQRASPDGPYVISPVGSAETGRSETQAPVSVTPTSEGSLVAAGAYPTDSTSQAAGGPTATLTPISHPGPSHGTVELGATDTVADPPLSSGDQAGPRLIPLPSLSVASDHDCVDPAAPGSIGPQMRSFRMGAYPRIAGRRATALAIVGFLAAATSAFVIAQSVRKTAVAPRAPTSATAFFPTAEPFEVSPPPTIAPPAFDDIAPIHPPPAWSIAAPASDASAAPTSSTIPEGSVQIGTPFARPAPSGKTDKKDHRPRVAPGQGLLEDRPGPGF